LRLAIHLERDISQHLVCVRFALCLGDLAVPVGVDQGDDLGRYKHAGDEVEL